MTHADRVRELREQFVAAAMETSRTSTVMVDEYGNAGSEEAQSAFWAALQAQNRAGTALLFGIAATCPTCKGTEARPARPDFPYMTPCDCDNGRKREER